MHYKGRVVTPQMLASMMRIIGVLYVAFPIYLAGIYFYRRGHIHWYTSVTEYSLLVILFSMAAVDMRRAKSGHWERFSPWFGFGQICGGLALATVINYTAGGDTTVYRLLPLLPAIAAAIMGDEIMIITIWVLTVTALGVVTYHQTHAVDTTGWLVAVWGVAMAGALVSIHVMVDRFLESIRVSDALRTLASGELSEWPEGIRSLLPEVAKALEVKQVEAVAVDRNGDVSLIGGWPEATDLSCVARREDGMRRALERAHPLAQEDAIIVPVRSAAEPHMVLIAHRHRKESYFNFEEEGTTAETVAGLVAGMGDRATLILSLRHQARSDPLTGLPNRRVLSEALEIEVSRSRRTGNPLSVVMIDIDFFKPYNDKFGHQAGDEMLKAFADRLSHRIRASDMVARYGGEEFCLVLPATTAQGAVNVIDGIRRDGPVRDSQGNAVTFSAGVSQWDGLESIRSLIAKSDQALYAAKEAGRDCVIVQEG